MVSVIPCSLIALTLADCFKLCILRYLGLWGLDEEGQFKTQSATTVTNFWSSFVGVKKNHNVADLVEGDIRESRLASEQELTIMCRSQYHDVDRNNRLLYHFQKDLLAGVDDMLMKNHDRREHNESHIVCSRSSKLLVCLFLLTESVCMLFYVFLFGVTKDSAHQRAWSQSFAVWLVLEIVVFASLLVIMNHIVVPLLLMGDLQAIRNKISSSVMQFQRRQRSKLLHLNNNNDQLKKSDANNEAGFNAAKYFFVSWRLSLQFMELPAAQLVLDYSTPWPKRSYLYVTEQEERKYSKKYAALFASASQVVAFFLTNYISLGVHIQDTVMQWIITVCIGYVTLLHVMLFGISPVLVFAPTAAVIVLCYVVFVTLANPRKASVGVSNDLQADFD